MLGRQTRAPRRQCDAIGDDERGVEADAELSDEMCVLGFVGCEVLKELARARLGDCANLVDHFLPRHADAVVRHGDGSLGLVEGDANLQIGIALEERRLGERFEPELVAGVRGVRHQLAQEDFFVAVQRMHHQVQQLLHLGLKAEGLSLIRCSHKGSSNPGSRVPVPALLRSAFARSARPAIQSRGDTPLRADPASWFSRARLAGWPPARAWLRPSIATPRG